MRVFIIILLFVTPFLTAQTEDTVYYNFDGVVSSKDSAFTVRYFKYDSISKRYRYREYSPIFASHNYSGYGELKSINPEIKDGKFIETDPLGNEITYLYKENEFVDVIDYRDSKGNKLEPIYPIRLVNFTSDTNLFYSNLIKIIREKLHAKNTMEIMNSCSTIIALFVIEVDCSISHFQTRRRNCNDILDQQIIDILNENILDPLSHNGKEVRTVVAIPILLNKGNSK